MKKKSQKVSKSCHYLPPCFHHLAPFFHKNVIFGFLWKKGGKRKNTIAIIWPFFFHHPTSKKKFSLFFHQKCPLFSLVEGDAKVRRWPIHTGDEENAEDRSCCVHEGHKVTLLQSCLNSKDHGDHQETHGKEELTKSVVLKHIVAVTTVVPQLDVKAEQREGTLWPKLGGKSSGF